jgi:hypothetical protein
VAALMCAVPIRVEGVHTGLCGVPHGGVVLLTEDVALS